MNFLLLGVSLDRAIPLVVLAIALLTLFGIIVHAAGTLSHPRFGRWWFLRGPSFRLPREGLIWLVVAGSLFIIGWLKALNLVLFVAYVMLGVWFLNFLLAGRRLHSLQGARRFDGPIFAGVPFQTEIEINHHGRGELIGVRVVDRGDDHCHYHLAVRLQPGETVRWSAEMVRAERGLYCCDPLLAISGYPFGLVQREAVVAGDAEIWVLPRLGCVHRGRLRSILGAAAPLDGWQRRVSRTQPLVPTEFHGVRPFQHGDSPRWVHWRTTARRGELMVREFEETSTDNLVLVLDPTFPGTAGDKDAGKTSKLLENAVSLAATICWEWCRKKDDHFTLAIAGPNPVILSGMTGTEHALRMLQALATVPGSRENGRDLLCERLAVRRLPPGPVLVIGMKTSDLVEVLAAHLQRPIVPLEAGELDRYPFYEKPGGGNPSSGESPLVNGGESARQTANR